jgi:hypothetical protein
MRRSKKQLYSIISSVRGAQSSTALRGRSLSLGVCGGLRLDCAEDQLGVRRTRDEVEHHAVALTVAVRPRGTDFEPGSFLLAFLLDDRINAMRCWFQLS